MPAKRHSTRPRSRDVQHNLSLVQGCIEAGTTSPTQIARITGMKVRTVYDYLKRLEGIQPNQPRGEQTEEAPAPRKRPDLAPEVQDCLQDDPEGFERFVNRYWPHEPLVPHLKRFVEAAYDPAGRWKLRVLINVPVDHAKTATFSTRMSIWRICQDRDFRRGIVSETQSLGNQIVEEIAAELDNWPQDDCRFCPEKHPSLVFDFGRFNSASKEVIWRLGQVGQLRVEASRIKRGYNIIARGLDQQIQGLRLDELVMDDIQGPTGVETEDRRNRLSHKLRNVVLSRLDPACRAYVIGTRQHLFDIYSELIGQRDQKGELFWRHLNFPAVMNWESHEVLWDCEQNGGTHKENFPKCCRSFQYLMEEAYPGIGADGFDLTYQQNPHPPGAALVMRDWIFGEPGCLDRDRPYGKQEREPGWVRAVAYDPSGGVRKAALVVADVLDSRKEFKVRILEVVHHRMGVRDALIQLERIAEIYQPNFFIPEYNLFRATNDIVDFDAWCRKYGVKPLKHQTGTNKNHATAGLESLAVDFEAGNIRIPYTSDEATQKTAHYLIDEALEYVRGSGGRSDDVLMALWFIKWNLNQLYVLRTAPRKALSHWTREKPNVWGKRSA